MIILLIVLAVVASLAYVISRQRSTENTVSINEVDRMDGHEFEYFCAKLLRTDGFSNVVVTQGSGDQGVDITATKGGVSYAVQCKRYSKHLGNTPVQEVYAGKRLYNCSGAIVMTNQYFTKGAIEAADATGVILWDRNYLQKLIRQRNMSIINYEQARKRIEAKGEKLYYPDESAWPHCAVPDIDMAYYEGLPHVEYVPGQKEYVKMFMLTLDELHGDDIVELISEVLTPEEAEHFAKAMEKHSYAITSVADNKVYARVHYRSIEANGIENNGKYYVFANWA